MPVVLRDALNRIEPWQFVMGRIYHMHLKIAKRKLANYEQTQLG